MMKSYSKARWLACLGVLALSVPVFAANQNVYVVVVDSQGVLLTDAQVGDQSAKSPSSSTTGVFVFNTELSRMSLDISHSAVGEIQQELSLPVGEAVFALVSLPTPKGDGSGVTVRFIPAAQFVEIADVSAPTGSILHSQMLLPGVKPSNQGTQGPAGGGQCPADSIFSQSLTPSSDGWVFGVADSDFTTGNIRRWESYSVNEPICDIHWGGIQTTPGFAASCGEVMEFEITFYPDAAGLPDLGSPACSYTATVAPIATGDVYAGAFPGQFYDLDLTPFGCCSLASGWVEIHAGDGPGDDAGCWFLWGSSGDAGSGSSLIDSGMGIMVDANAMGGGPFDLSLCLTPSQGPPPNPEECADCHPIGNSFVGTTTDNTGVVDDTSCTFSDEIDEWLCWTADCTGLATASLCGSAYDTSVGIFADDCTTELACDDDNFGACGPGNNSEVSWAVTSGTSYRIRVSGFGGDTGDYTLNMSCTPPPDNDNCVGSPTPIAGDGTYPFNTTLATTDGPDHPGVAVCNKFGATNIFNDVWYCWTAACDATVTADLCGSSGDTKMAVYDGCTCPTDATNLLDCNDDFCSVQSSVTFSATGGNSYLIRVGTWTDTLFPSGDLNITSTPSCAPPTGSDDCASGPTPIAGEGTFDFDNTTATEDGPADCQKPAGGPTIPNDVWFCWTSPCTDIVTLSTCDGLANGVDTKVAVYDGCTCFGTQLLCDDDGCSGGAPFDSEGVFNAVMGQSYLIRMGVFPAGSPAGGVGQFSLTCGAPPGPCGDPNAGSCCVDNGTPGCDDEACCNTICACDDFCCDTAWDGGCAGGGFMGSGCGAAILCPDLCAPPANDLCVDSIGPLAVPSTTGGTTEVATTDTGFPSPCGAGSITSPGVWYTVIGTGNTMTADLCNGATNYNSKLNVYCKGCIIGETTCVDGNNDFCGDQSSVTWCSQSGVEYLILVHGFAGGTGPFELVLSDDSTTCTGAVACAPTGACCNAGNCSELSADECTAAGGDYLGEGTDCDPILGGDNFDSGAVGLPVVDDGGPQSNSIDVQGVGGNVGDVNVGVDISHTWVGDLKITIEHLGTTVVLVEQPGDAGDLIGGAFGCSDDNYSIVLDDEGTGGTIEGLCNGDNANTSPPNYIPNDALSAFLTMPADGLWTLTVEDVEAIGTDEGTFNNWSLNFPDGSGPVPVCTPQGACCQDDGSCELTEELACTGAYLGDNVPCNSPGTPIGVFGSPNVAIPDNDLVVGASDTINMATSGTITDVDVELVITHTFIGDLQVDIEHLGTTVSVIVLPGDPSDTPGSGGGFGCGNDNYDIVLDDAGTGGAIEDQCNGNDMNNSPPSYTPNNPLSAFNTLERAGDWTITVFDTAGADTGTLNSWGVTFGEDPGGSNCPVCGNSLVEAGEECDDGNTDAGDCCSADCQFEDTSTVCNASTGVCDPVETCDGAGSCDADVLADSSFVCRPSTDDCDPAENCTGSSADCPANEVITACLSGDPAFLDGCCPDGCNANNDDDCTPICGNDVVEGDEECDDGNNDSGDGCDEACNNEGPPVPTVSQWGLLVLALMLLVGGKVYFGRRHATA